MYLRYERHRIRNIEVMSLFSRADSPHRTYTWGKYTHTKKLALPSTPFIFGARNRPVVTHEICRSQAAKYNPCVIRKSN